MTLMQHGLLKRRIALPQDHGSWIFLLSPLLIGLFAGGSWSTASGLVVIAALSAFLIRQPVTITVKAYSGRRSRKDLPAAWFWTAIYSIIGGAAMVGLIIQGFGYVLFLAIPGLPVFIWRLLLVSRRAERRNMAVELVGCGTLALAAPAAYWIGVGYPSPIGWMLWALTWLQSAASIVYAYLRLEQRELTPPLSLREKLRLGQRALLYTTFNLLLVAVLTIRSTLPSLLTLPYALQWLETLQGIFRPAYGIRPTAIGVRQLMVSIMFTLLFILTWN